MLSKVLPILSSCILLAVSVQARTWVVANTAGSASDSNPGTAALPLLTINAAAQEARPGDTVLVHGGIYRERVAPLAGGVSGQPIIYETAPGETVTVKGSDVWMHWQPVPGQPGVFTATIGGHVPDGAPDPFCTGISISATDRNIVARPWPTKDHLPKTLGQVFFDGRPVIEVDSEAVVPVQENSWTVTADGSRLFAHFPGNPASLSAHLVEVSVRNRIFAPAARGLNFIQVRGFTFEHCANQGPFPQGGEVSPRSGSDWLIDGNTIRYAKTVGLDVGSETWAPQGLKETPESQKVRINGGHDIIQNNIISDNGLSGIEGWKHNGAVIRNNVIERNNALGFSNTDKAWEEWAGIKLHEGAALIEGNLIRDNDCYGIWLDNNWGGSRITRNVVLSNRMAGIFLELGDGHALIDNNIVGLSRPRDRFYGGCGIYSHDASGLVIAHNLIFGNADCGILLRAISNRVFKGQIVHVSNTRILNNIVWNNSRAAICLPYPGDRAWDNISDYNILCGGRDVWLGFDAEPGLFSVNICRSSITVDQLYSNFKAVLAKGSVPALDWPDFKTWRRNPTLSLAQWRLFMGQDLHSAESPSLFDVLLRPEIPMITYKADAGFLAMRCSPVDGVDRDFFGNRIPPSNIRPGPFQDISQAGTEQAIFPVRTLVSNPSPTP